MDGDSCYLNCQPILEAESKKSNIDCVHFLASPLTCNKGSDCEYRHSENARMNPRDCWFWLNANCLNPKYAFRHPPLDRYRGPSGAASSVALPQPPRHADVPFHHSQSYASSRKNNVPCYYFQTGNCLKGHKCHFMHGPQPLKVPVFRQIARATPVSNPQVIRTFTDGSEDQSFRRKHPGQTNEVDESLGESPPGLDVLVSDGDHEDENFDAESEIAPGHDGMHLSSVREFNRMGPWRVDEFLCEEGELYDAYGKMQEQIIRRALHRRFSKRMHTNKRRWISREKSADQRDVHDLRHRLLKRRRSSGSGAIPNGHVSSHRMTLRLREDLHHKLPSHEELRRPNAESSLRNRLLGRIKFPARTSRENSSNGYSSNSQSQTRILREGSSPSGRGFHQGRHHERATGRANGDVGFQVKELIKVQNAGSEERKTGSFDFAGPKSLTELKGAKISESCEEQTSASANRQAPTRNQVAHGEEWDMKMGKCSNQNSNGFLSFENPRHLSDIFKRKKEMGLTISGETTQDGDFTERRTHVDVRDTQSIVLRPTELERDDTEASRSPIITGGTNREFYSADELHPLQAAELTAEVGDDVLEEDAMMLDAENLGFEDGETEEEEIEDEENQDHYMEEERLNDEEGDDFARKLGFLLFT